MKFRYHTGGLKESLATTIEIEPPTRESLAKALSITKEEQVDPNTLLVEFYAYDDRIGWNTYIVTDKDGVLGFTDGPLVE